MLQYGITFRLNDLLMLSEAYSKLAKTNFNSPLAALIRSMRRGTIS